MKNILYIGNNLNQKHFNLSTIKVLGPLLESEGYRVFYTSSKVNKLARVFDMLLSIISHIRRVDVVLLDTYSTQNFYYALLASQCCRFFKMDYIPILHGGNIPRRLKHSPKLSNLIFKHAYKLVSPSLYMQQAFKDHGYLDVIYIPNTIELSKYPYNEKLFDDARLLWVRSFSKIYNPLLAVELLKCLGDRGVKASLCMVGPDSDGSLKDVEALAKTLEVPVIFTGKLSKEAWTALAKDYNIFINTTHFDNMPVSVIEAMALGLVVVSTHVGGMPYLIKDGDDGLLVEPNTVNGFVEAIGNLLGDPNIANDLAKHARRKVEQFDWQIVKHQWFEILR